MSDRLPLGEALFDCLLGLDIEAELNALAEEESLLAETPQPASPSDWLIWTPEGFQ